MFEHECYKKKNNTELILKFSQEYLPEVQGYLENIQLASNY